MTPLLHLVALHPGILVSMMVMLGEHQYSLKASEAQGETVRKVKKSYQSFPSKV